MEHPFFSIIMPTFNRAQFLNRSINSIRQQHYINWELLIIDDGSTDSTREVVQKFTQIDQRIKYIYQTNQKPSVARNRGLQEAVGKYICFLDSDDEYDQLHLQFFYDHLSKMNFSEVFLYTRFRFKDGSQENTYVPPHKTNYRDKCLTQIMQVFLPYSPPVQTICLPASVKNKVAFNPLLFPSECYDFCAKAAAHFQPYHFPITTVTLHGHIDNASVPRTPKELQSFYMRQYEEFQILKRNPFYKHIIKTKAFKNKLFSLKLAIANTNVAKTTISNLGLLILTYANYPSLALKSLYYKLTKVLRPGFLN